MNKKCTCTDNKIYDPLYLHIEGRFMTVHFTSQGTPHINGFRLSVRWGKRPASNILMSSKTKFGQSDNWFN